MMYCVILLEDRKAKDKLFIAVATMYTVCLFVHILCMLLYVGESDAVSNDSLLAADLSPSSLSAQTNVS